MSLLGSINSYMIIYLFNIKIGNPGLLYCKSSHHRGHYYWLNCIYLSVHLLISIIWPILPFAALLAYVMSLMILSSKSCQRIDHRKVLNDRSRVYTVVLLDQYLVFHPGSHGCSSHNDSHLSAALLTRELCYKVLTQSMCVLCVATPCYSTGSPIPCGTAANP